MSKPYVSYASEADWDGLCTHGADCPVHPDINALHGPDPGQPAIISPRMREIITSVDDWLDGAVADTYKGQPLAQDWARVAKVAEECGEAVSALIAYTGQNPRKGVCGTLDEVLKELADVVCTGLLAIQHFTKDADDTAAIAEASLLKVAGRAREAQTAREERLREMGHSPVADQVAGLNRPLAQFLADHGRSHNEFSSRELGIIQEVLDWTPE